MNWKNFFWSALLIAVVKASIPQGDLPENPSFDCFFKHLAKLFKNPYGQFIKECPFTTARIVLTLSKYVEEYQRPYWPYNRVTLV